MPTLTAPEAQPKKIAYTAAEVMALLNIGETTLWRLAKKGLLKPVAGLRNRIYSVGAVERFLATEAVK